MSTNNVLILSKNKDNLFELYDCDAEDWLAMGIKSGKEHKVEQAVGLLAALKKARKYMREEIVEYNLVIDDSVFKKR